MSEKKKTVKSCNVFSTDEQIIVQHLLNHLSCVSSGLWEQQWTEDKSYCLPGGSDAWPWAVDPGEESSSQHHQVRLSAVWSLDCNYLKQFVMLQSLTFSALVWQDSDSGRSRWQSDHPWRRDTTGEWSRAPLHSVWSCLKLQEEKMWQKYADISMFELYYYIIII